VGFGNGQLDELVVSLGDHDIDVDQRGQRERRGQPYYDNLEDKEG
jgi:hypothetical protein